MGSINRQVIFRVFTLLSVLIFECNASDTGDVTPLNLDTPVANANAKIIEKDAKKYDRLDIAPEYYK